MPESKVILTEHNLNALEYVGEFFFIITYNMLIKACFSRLFRISIFLLTTFYKTQFSSWLLSSTDKIVELFLIRLNYLDFD